MKGTDIAWILGGVLLNALAQLLLKAGAASAGPISGTAGASVLLRVATGLVQHPAILGGLACYAISVVVWIVALSRVEVSIAYPMLSVGYVVNAVFAWWLFGEEVNVQRWLGMVVIVGGVVLVARSGSTP